MSSVFTKIINGEIACYKIFEDQKIFVILDAFPMELGHCLIIVKNEIDNWLDVSSEDYLAVHSFALKLGVAIENSVQDREDYMRIGQMVDGRAVPHFHLHLIPLYEGREITHNEKTRLNFTQQEMQQIQFLIIENLKNLKNQL